MITIEEAGGTIIFFGLPITVGWQAIVTVVIFFAFFLYDEVWNQREAAAIGMPAEPARGFRLAWHNFSIFAEKSILLFVQVFQTQAMVSSNYFITWVSFVGGTAMGDMIFSWANEKQARMGTSLQGGTLDPDIVRAMNGRKIDVLAMLAQLPPADLEEGGGIQTPLPLPPQAQAFGKQKMSHPAVRAPSTVYDEINMLATFVCLLISPLAFLPCITTNARQRFHAAMAMIAEGGFIAMFVLSTNFLDERYFYFLVGAVLVAVYARSAFKVFAEKHNGHVMVRPKNKRDIQMQGSGYTTATAAVPPGISHRPLQ